MFTGIVQTTGKVKELKGSQLSIEAPGVLKNLKKGSSVSVDGVCLTVIDIKDKTFKIDYMPETSEKTIIQNYQVGQPVNLELALKQGDPFDGHLVSGHVEGVGKVLQIEVKENAHLIQIEVPESLMRYVIIKGSIAINGISLTIVDLKDRVITVGIIPHTWKETNLNHLKAGDSVNIETDFLAKYAEKMNTQGNVQ